MQSRVFKKICSLYLFYFLKSPEKTYLFRQDNLKPLQLFKISSEIEILKIMNSKYLESEVIENDSITVDTELKAEASIKTEDEESETKYNGKANSAPVKIEFKKKEPEKIPVEMKHKSTMKKPRLANKGKFVRVITPLFR